MVQVLQSIYKNWRRIELFPDKLPEALQSELLMENVFYANLNARNKRFFEHRVLDFMETYTFVGREGVLITDSLKLRIAATAIQLTFGYRHYLFYKIDTIVVYPSSYFSPFGNQKHDGETNPKYKVVIFSLEHFEQGNAIADDNLNLGLHEFTHAMHLSFMATNNSSARYFKRHYRNLLSFMESRKEQRKLIEAGYVRDYAYENQYEFLAVLIEHFFETPEEFKVKLPEIYNHIKKILRIRF
ncbi:zinc-dependent peptidase [Urechidicola sp. KH5]